MLESESLKKSDNIWEHELYIENKENQYADNYIKIRKDISDSYINHIFEPIYTRYEYRYIPMIYFILYSLRKKKIKDLA